MSDSTITFLVLGVTVAVFVWDRLPVAAVALGRSSRDGCPTGPQPNALL
jgi:hypothetical protein